MTPKRSESRGLGHFVTHLVRPHPAGGHEVASARRHRKGHRPHRVWDLASAERPQPTRARAFLHLWAPGRLGWWIAILFGVGSLHFAVGGFASSWPAAAPAPLRDVRVVNAVFFAGSIFFTSAAWLQWLEALNSDVGHAFDPGSAAAWRFFGWRSRDLGVLASAVQLAGTVLFNFDTGDAMISGLGWREEDLVVWTPNMLGCVCFLVASGLSLYEICHGHALLVLRSVSWWIGVINLAGSVAFQISALTAFAGPSPAASSAIFWSSLTTGIGALCFFFGAYLLIPELFDE